MLAANRPFRALGWGCVLLLVPFVFSLKPWFPDSNILDLRLFGMVALWLILGWTMTEVIKEFISMVGPAGYAFWVGVTMIGVGLSGITTEPLFI